MVNTYIKRKERFEGGLRSNSFKKEKLASFPTKETNPCVLPKHAS